MKKIFIVSILFFSSYVYGSQLQYFYTDKVYFKIINIQLISKIKNVKKITKSEGNGFYQNYYIPYYTYEYLIRGKYLNSVIICRKKINFSKLTDKINLMKFFKCKEKK